MFIELSVASSHMVVSDRVGGFGFSVSSFIILCSGKHQSLLVILKYIMTYCRQQLGHFCMKHGKKKSSCLLTIDIFLCMLAIS